MNNGQNQDPHRSDAEQFEDPNVESNSHDDDNESSTSSVLEEILAETRATAEGTECLDMIVGFCKSHSDRVELDQEIVHGIVKLILSKKFSKTPMPEGCSDWITEVLYFDPESRQKIEEVWKEAHLRIA